MPINPLQFTQPQAYSGGADFTPLSKLYDVYKASQERAMQEQALGRLGDDPMANARILAQSGTLPLAQLGLGMQDKEIVRRREDIANQQAQANWVEQQKLRQAAEGRAQAEADVTLPIQQSAEQRAAVKFAEAQKYATREQRLAAYKTGVEAGEVDKDNPEIKRWVAFGGEIPDAAKARFGIGTPVYTQNMDTGEVVAHQLRADQPFVTPPRHKLLGPGEVAQQKAEGTVTGKTVGKAVLDLPKIEADANLVTKTIDKALAPHEGKSWTVGTMFKDVPALPGSKTANYRAILDQLDSQTFLDAYNSLRGGGHISDYEDKRASGAKARLGRAQSVEEFDNALKEYKEIIQSGVASARRTAARSVMGGGGPASAPAAAKPDPLGLR